MLLFCDGMDSFSVQTDLYTKYLNLSTTYLTFDSSNGRWGGGALKVPTSSGSNFGIWAPLKENTQTHIRIACWVKFSANPSSTMIFMVLWNSYPGSSTLGNNGSVWINTSGQLSFYTWTIGTNSGSGLPVIPKAICDNVWHHLEIYVNYADSGSIIVKIDGVTYNLGTLDTYTSGTVNFKYINFLSTYTPNNSYMDDLIIWNDENAGTMFANALPTPHRISTLRPNGAGDTTQFTASSGSNYACVNETAPNLDTSYVETSTTGQIDLYNYESMPVTADTIFNAVANTYIKSSETKLQNFKVKCKSGGTTSTDSSVSAPTAYNTYQKGFIKDPSTDTAWSNAGINAAQFGFESDIS